MNTRHSLPRRRRRALSVAAILLSAVAAPLLAVQMLSGASALAAPRGATEHLAEGAVAGSGGQAQITSADGLIAEGQRVAVNADVPAVTNLAPELRRALTAAAAEAAADGVQLRVNSGWRSPAYQEQLQRDAVSTYGSAEEAARWVAGVDTSEHVSGDAVDVGPWDAADWLGRHGESFGLCLVYDNEPWHFELRPDAARDGCPRTFRDPAARTR